MRVWLLLSLHLLGCSLSGCGPSVLWRARSEDLSHRIEVRAEGALQQAWIDGVAGAGYASIGAGAVVFTRDGAAYYAARDESGAWRVVGPAGEGASFLEVALPLRTLADQPLYVAADREGWRVVHGDRIGPAFSNTPTDLTLLLGDAHFGYVARDATSARWMWGELAGPGFDAIDLVRVGDARVVYAGTRDDGAHIVSSTPSGTAVGAAHESVLELAAAAHGPGYAALLGIEDHTELLHAPAGDEAILTSAPLLTHLRVSEDGMHTACLSAAPDGRSIEVLLDGASIAQHRRVDGARLTFLPGSARLVWVAEDAQGLVVHVRDESAEDTSERFEAIDGPFVARGSVGFIGRRAGRAEVWIDGERVADEAYAAQLRLGPSGRYAFMVRQGGERFVVTRRGRWPVPRFFIDTLTLDASGDHWAALVPDAGEHVLSVWIDGVPHVEVAAEEVLEPALAMGIDPAAALRQMVRAVLTAHSAAE